VAGAAVLYRLENLAEATTGQRRYLSPKMLAHRLLGIGARLTLKSNYHLNLVHLPFPISLRTK
jgi:hypothetical protein